MKESKDYFAEVAKSWDEMRKGYFTEHMRDEAIKLIDLASDSVVADVGCGTGFMAEGLAPIVKGVVGFDESPQMLKIAESNLRNFGNVSFITSGGEDLPAEDNHFDAVFANMYLHHTREPLEAIKEMFRVTRPGGWVMIIDMDTHNHKWMKEVMADRWLGFRRDDIANWFAEAGLKNPEISCAKGSCCTVSPDGNNLAIGIFIALGQK